MNIHNEIKTAIINGGKQNGRIAKRIYLGRNQMKRLMQYIGEPQMVQKEGLHRPKVEGCLVYEVNDDDHCVAV